MDEKKICNGSGALLGTGGDDIFPYREIIHYPHACLQP